MDIQSLSDYSLFFKNADSHFIALLVYVDDAILASTHLLAVLFKQKDGITKELLYIFIFAEMDMVIYKELKCRVPY
jgi:hypothetical protein